MRFTPDMAAAFGDWLELDLIRRALVAARPELDGVLTPDARRPLLRIPRPDGGLAVVARMSDAERAPWVVGIAGGSAPMLHEFDSLNDVVALVLHLLDPSALAPGGAESTAQGWPFRTE
ncbi:hypothetical protein GCM10023160_14170 [Brachybacterium paraconglomeratum]|uniref:hypothetical protein n=1 Tax=Brachybacterium paraconglomeratum TaxID=173362 RepID=UPI0031E51553